MKPPMLLGLTLVIWTVFTILACRHADAFNPDTTYYLSTAALFNQHGFAAAFSGFSRPFYPILIGIVHKTLGVGYFTSAYIVNIIAQLCIILGLFQLAKSLKLKPNYYVWLCVLILVSPVLTTVRAFIIRDFGFLAAWIFGFTALLQYAEQGKKKQLFLYHILLLVSILFRSDGCVLWLLLPLGLLFYENGRKKALHSYAIALSVVVLALIFIFFIKHNFLPKNIGFYLSTYINQSTTQNLYHTLFSSLLLAKSQEALQYVAVTKIFLYGLPVYFVLHVFSSFNYFLSIFLLIGIKAFNTDHNRKLFYWAVIVYLFMLAVFFAQNLFFSSRYQAGMSLLLFLPAAYGMGWVWEKGAKHIWLRVIMLLVLIFAAVYYNWPKADSRAYQMPAVAWLKQQTGVICSNQRTILFATVAPGVDFQRQVIDVKVDPRLPATWQLEPTVLQAITTENCRWVVLTTHQASSSQVSQLQQQLSQQLHADMRYQTHNDNRVLWVFERHAGHS